MQPEASCARGVSELRADELRAPKNCAAEELTLPHEDARLGAAAEDRVELAHVARGERRHLRLRQCAAAGAGARGAAARRRVHLLEERAPRHRALLAADLADAEDGDRHLALHVRLEPRRQEVGVWTVELGRRRAGVDLRERRHVLPQRGEARRTAVRRVEGAEVVHPRA